MMLQARICAQLAELKAEDLREGDGLLPGALKKTTHVMDLRATDVPCNNTASC